MLTDLLAEHRSRVLITLDEIHQNQLDESREPATTVQHAFREGREPAFAGAGLASSVSDVVNDDELTFPNAEEITEVDATEGVTRARRRLGVLVHEPALRTVSDIDKAFLLAMAQDDGPSKMADVQRRLGVDVNYAGQYRLRLIAAELIHSTRRGYVDFALPYLREYLRDDADADM